MVSRISASFLPVRALVVDDDSEARQRICKALSNKGIEVRACSSLSQGRECFDAEPIVLARSPGESSEFNGFVDWVRERSGKRQPYIVAIDDGAGAGDAMRGAAANPGCNAVMPTPGDEVDLEERLVAIDRWLESQNGRREAAIGRAAIVSPFQAVPREETVPREEGIGYANILLENAPAAMAMFDREMRYLVANRKWREEFHLEDVALEGRSHYEVFPALPESWRSLFERCLSLGLAEGREEDFFRRPDGTTDWVRWEVRPWKRVDGTIGGLTITSEVVTERRHREESLRFERSFTASFLEEAEVPVMTVDLEGKVQQRNPASEALLPGLAREKGEPFYWDVLGDAVETAEEKLSFVKAVGDLREAGRLESSPAFICRLPGTAAKSGAAPARRRFAWSRIPQFGEGGAVDGFVLVGAELPVEEDPESRAGASPPAPRIVAIGALPREEWKRREKEILAERNRFAAMSENAPVGMILLDPEGRTIYCNPQHKAVLGFDAGEEKDMEAWLRRGCPDAEYAEEVLGVWREKIWRRQLPEVIALATVEGLLKEIRFDSKLLGDGNLLVIFSDVTEARRLEEALSASEAKCRAFFQGSRAGMILVDRCGDVFDVNAALEGMLGYPRWEIRSKPLSAFIRPEDCPNLEVVDAASADADHLHGEIELRLVRKDGGTVWARLNASPVRDHEGSLLFTAYTVNDLTGKREEGASLAGNGGRGRALLEAIPDLIMMLDGNGMVVDMIPQTSEFHALEAERFLRERLGSAFDELADRIHGLIREVHAGGGGAVRFEFSTSRNAAEARRLEARLVECGERDTIVTIGDVTDREAAQTRLRRRALAFENAGEAIVLTDVRGRVTDFNPASERLFGYAKADIAGKPLCRIFEPEDPKEFSERISAAMVQERRWAGKTRFFHADGSEGMCEVHYVPVEDEKGKVTALVGVNRAVPAEDSAASARAAAAVHGKVGADLHLIGKIAELQAESLPREAGRRLLEESRNRILSLSIVHQLLADSGERGRVDFTQFIEALVDQLRRSFGVSKERVDVVLEWQNGWLRLDEAVPLALIANELIANAFEHAFPGGRRGVVKVRFVHQGELATFTVADDGIGLPLTFDLDSPASLGLRVVKILVDRLDGRIMLADSPDTEFHVRFRAGDD